MAEARYAFGDTAAAASRLELLAEVFAPPSRSLLGTVAGRPVELAVDLGCGPGFSTRLVGSEIRPRGLAGMDLSEAFLDRARTHSPEVAWHRHDVTAVPFPTGPADLLFARLVLAHLPRPEAVLGSWLTQLRPDGHLLVEEDEDIVADHPVLATYEDMAADLVAHRGGDLYVGRRLAHWEPPAGFRAVVKRVYDHRVPVPVAARMFSMNFETWRGDDYVVARYSARELDAMGLELGRLSRSDEAGAVTFRIRQVSYLRSGTPPRA